MNDEIEGGVCSAKSRRKAPEGGRRKRESDGPRARAVEGRRATRDAFKTEYTRDAEIKHKPNYSTCAMVFAERSG